MTAPPDQGTSGAEVSDALRGLAQPISSTGVESRGAQDCAPDGPLPSTNKVIGVVCSGDVAVYRDDVKRAIERGLAQRPDAVWVCIEPKSDRMTYDVMFSLDIDPVVLPLVDYFKVKGTAPDGTEVNSDVRRVWRDNELLHLCDELIVFHKRTASSPWRERYERKSKYHFRNLFLVELGAPPKAKPRAKRKPVGA